MKASLSLRVSRRMTKQSQEARDCHALRARNDGYEVH